MKLNPLLIICVIISITHSFGSKTKEFYNLIVNKTILYDITETSVRKTTAERVITSYRCKPGSYFDKIVENRTYPIVLTSMELCVRDVNNKSFSFSVFKGNNEYILGPVVGNYTMEAIDEKTSNL